MTRIAILLSLLIAFDLAYAESEQTIYIIESGLVYDGSDNPPNTKSIGICGARLCDISKLSHAQIETATRIDAEGLILSPGFIDPHTHSHSELKSEDLSSNLNYLFQGVTTVVNGNDGGGPVDIAGALNGLNQHGIGTNYAFFVGHGSLREAVMGTEQRFSTANELKQMELLLDSAMQQGALGLSSGLYYVPGSYAETSEVIALAKVAAKHGGIYDTHLRDESTFNIGFIPALQEAIDIAKAANIHLHVAHIKALGVDVWGQSKQAISLIEKEQEKGTRITADQYPWQASGTNIRSALVPKWAMADSNTAFMARLEDPNLRPKINLEIADNIRRRGGGDRLLITAANDSSWEGQTLAQLGQLWQTSQVDSVVKMVKESRRTRVASFNMQDDDIQAFMQKDWVVTSSDGTNGHPRKYASFPRKYHHYVKELELISEADFIHRSTGKTATILGIKERGYIKNGYKADIVIFNPSTFRGLANFQNWNTLSQGVKYLFVNGQLAIDKGKSTGVLAGEYVARE